MALRTPTYIFGDVMSMVARQVGRTIEDNHAVTICNVAVEKIWRRYDWRESLSELPPFFLIPGEQDYGAPYAAIPSNFYGLRKAWLGRTTSEPPYQVPLMPIKELEVTHVKQLPHAIGFAPDVAAFRVFPRVPDGIGAPDYFVGGTYKMRAPTVTAATLATTRLPFDDAYMIVMFEMLKWAAFNFAGDPRAGEVSKQLGGAEIYSGQLAKAMSAVDEMARNEGLELGDPIIRPSEPLVGTSVYSPIFGARW